MAVPVGKFWGLLFLAVYAAAFFVSCSRRETAGRSEATRSASPTETSEPAEPTIRETAVSGRAAWFGLREPRDGAVDDKGRVWIADFGNSRLRIFDADGGYLGGWGGLGNGNLQFREPSAVAIRGNDLYVADTWNGRVQYFSIAGEWKATAAGLYGPRGVAVGQDGRVWVTDTGNHKVVAFAANLSEPKAFGEQGNGRDEFSSPVGIAVGPSGSVYVADTGNRRVQILDSKGAFERAIPIEGWEGRIVEPHVDVGSDGSVYVSDATARAVLEFSPTGTLKRRLTEGAGKLQFTGPVGLAIDSSRGVLYVVEPGANTVARLEIAASPAQ
jgi:tripartite motif-containing protein 71